jgi:site-specific DNA recombinase
LTDAIPEGPFSHIFESIIDFGSQHFIHVLSNNVSRGHHKSLSQGFIPGANPPIGYRKVKVEMNERRNGEPRMGVKWEIDEKTAPLVRQAFELRAAGYSTSEIMAKTGLYNSRQGMHHMLRNPIYKGVFVYGDRQYDNLVAPLVDERTWNACQQRRAVHPRTEAGEYLLSGLLRCARCGYAMSGFRTIKRLKNGRVWEKRYYICTNRNARALRDPTRCLAPLVPAAEIEQAVLQIVFSDLLAPEPFRRFRDALRVDEGFDDRAERRSSLDQQIKRLEKANRDLVRLVGLDLEVEEAAETLRQRQAQLAGLRRERAELDDLPPLLTMADDEAIRHIDELAERLRTGTTSVKRWVLQRVIASLSWGPNLKIKFKLPGD